MVGLDPAERYPYCPAGNFIVGMGSVSEVGVVGFRHSSVVTWMKCCSYFIRGT